MMFYNNKKKKPKYLRRVENPDKEDISNESDHDKHCAYDCDEVIYRLNFQGWKHFSS